MPPLVARAWHSVVARRSLSHLVDPHSSAILIPSNPATAQPHDLIPLVQPRARAKLGRHCYPVFFVTPAFATWLQDPDRFLKPALEALYRPLLDDTQARPALHVLAAVVDKLPTPQPIADVAAMQHEAVSRTLHPPVSDTGHEGVAYALLRYMDLVHPPPDQEETGSDRHGSIYFPGSASDGHVDTLHLPLANTIFHTGSNFTMFKSTWARHPSKKFELVMESKTDLNKVGIKLYPDQRSQDNVSALSIPLVPLTYPRYVSESMGNILRRVRGPDQVDVQASSELEQAVPHYFDSRNQPAQSISVWALVIPEHIVPNMVRLAAELVAGEGGEDNPLASATLTSPTEVWKAFWRSDPAKWNDLVPSALARGARLHRVLSGGGGWGNKAGLLALDPSFHGDDLPSQLPAIDGSEGPQDFESAVHRIVKSKSDAIQFFASPVSPDSTSTSYEANSAALENLSTSSQPTWTWELGTIPSTADTLQNTSWQYANASVRAQEDRVFVFPNSFGALSEGALVLKSESKNKKTDARVLSSGTTIDVPFSRFSAVLMQDLEKRARMREGSIKGRQKEAGSNVAIDVHTTGDHNSGPPFHNSYANNKTMFASLEYRLKQAAKSTRRLEMELKDILPALSLSVANTTLVRDSQTTTSTGNNEQPKPSISTLNNFWEKQMRKVRISIRHLAQQVDEVLDTIQDSRVSIPRFLSNENNDSWHYSIEDLRTVIRTIHTPTPAPRHLPILRVESTPPEINEEDEAYLHILLAKSPPNSIPTAASAITKSLTTLHTTLRSTLRAMLIRRHSQPQKRNPKHQHPFISTLQNTLIRLRVLQSEVRGRRRERLGGESRILMRRRRKRGIVRFYPSSNTTLPPPPPPPPPPTTKTKTPRIRKHITRSSGFWTPSNSPDSRIAVAGHRGRSVPLVESGAVRIRTFAYGAPRRRERRVRAIRRREEGVRMEGVGAVMGAVEGWLRGF